MAGLSPEAGFEMLESGKYSDFTITCGDRTFKVHRGIICAQSDFFQAVCASKFKVLQPFTATCASTHTCQESIEAKVDLPEDEPEIVARVLEYLYTANYDEDKISTMLVHPAEELESMSLSHGSIVESPAM